MVTNYSKKNKIIDIKGSIKKITCLSCAIVNREVEPLGAFPQTKYFDAHQDFEIPIPGFIILTSKRHVQGIDEFTKNEQEDFIQLLCLLRRAMRKSLNIKCVKLFQDEDTRHHFHLWLFPNYPWMEKNFGKGIESIRPIIEYAREHMKTVENIESVESAVLKINQFLKKN